MCGIFGFLSKGPASQPAPAGRTALTMLEALACRGPDSAGVAVIGPSRGREEGTWSVRVAGASEAALALVAGLGQLSRIGTDGSSLAPIPPCDSTSGRRPA